MLLSAVERMDEMDLLIISKLPKLAAGNVGLFLGFQSTGDADNRNLNLREFHPSASTYKQREVILFKMIKMLSALVHIPGSSELTDRLDRIDEECETELHRIQQPSNPNVDLRGAFERIRPWGHCYEILTILEMLLQADPGVMLDFCKPLAFTTSATACIQTSGDDEDEDEGEGNADGSSTNDSFAARTRAVATVRRDIGSLLSVLKYLAVLRLFTEQMKLDKLVRELFDLQREFGKDADLPRMRQLSHELANAPKTGHLIENLFADFMAAPQLATIISRLHTLESQEPSLKNLWTQTVPNHHGPVFCNGESSVGLVEWKGATRLIISGAQDHLS
jgi:hypothetical protein